MRTSFLPKTFIICQYSVITASVQLALGCSANLLVYRWLLLATAEIEQPLWRIWYHTGVYPKHLRLPSEVSLARQDFTDLVGVMEEHMQGRKFIVGNTVTIASKRLCLYPRLG